MRTPMRRASLFLALIPVIAVAISVPTPTPLSYSTTFTDPSGTPQSVSFTGTASHTSLTGTLTVNGAPEQVPATIGSDGSVSGTLLSGDGFTPVHVVGATQRRAQHAEQLRSQWPSGRLDGADWP